ncbi:MAG: hypothetical protein Unbinned4162contig1001_64 [Prokaryotic dsDNA virus sp.]|nr:MAG: hypothetical protein Unbinned4162contig1001_64 [Prokaryotic dsDNA virus sp.]|tara:strand:- start:44757 stop:45698 length:942 start_codon:yes stop_codon:yes gene_type:complete
MADGSRHSLYAVKEDTYNVTPTDPALELVRITGTTLGLAKDTLESQEIRSDRQIAEMRMGANRVAGDINFELSYTTFDTLLEAVLMSAPWEVDTPVAGTDQIKCGQTRNSFTFVRNFADLATKSYFVYTGCEINQMTLSIPANNMITGTFSVVGASQTIVNDLSAMGTPTFPPATTTAALDSFTGNLNENGTTIAVITEIQLTLNNNIEPRYVVGQKNSIRNSVGRSNLTGQITAYFEDASLVEKFINEVESDIDFQLPDPDGNVQKHRLPRIKYTGGQPDVTSEGPITLTLPFQALLDPATGTNYLIERTPA